ncbi:MAG: hypothetical protein AAF152_09965 [Cyanobacteria bacterium P01_A01_bin.114]
MPASRSQDLSPTPSSKQLILLWVGMNTLGFAIATPLSLIRQLSALYFFGPLFLAGLIVGAVVGPLQAVCLRQTFPKIKPWQWIAANILGSYVGSWLGLFANGGLLAIGPALFNSWFRSGGALQFGPLIVFAVYGLVIGLFVGLGQVLVLRNHAQGLRQWWLANLLGRALGWFSGGALGWVLSQYYELSGLSLLAWSILLGALGGGVYAGVTAKALLNLKSHPLKKV